MRYITLLVFIVVLVALSGASRATIPQDSFGNRLGGNDRVLHIKAEHRTEDGSGKGVTVRQTQFYYDPLTQDVRYHKVGIGGADELVSTRRGLKVTTYYPADGHYEAITAADSSAPFLNATRDEVLGYKVRAENGLLKVVGEENVKGKPAVIARDTILPEDGGAEQTEILDTAVDKASGLPVQQKVYKRTVLGRLDRIVTKEIDYSTVEELDRSAVATNLFELPAPRQDSTFHRQHYFTPQSAVGIKDFELYWVGPTFGDIPLFGITRDEARTADGPVPLSVAITYAHPFVNGVQLAAGQLNIVQTLVPTPEVRRQRDAAAEQSNSSIERVTIGGNSGVFYGLNTTTPRLELEVKRTLVTLSGGDRAMIVQAAESLIRLN